MTAAAPALATLCTCGHAARMHDADGCLRNFCGCSRDRAAAAGSGGTQLDVAPAAQTVPEPAAPPPAATPAESPPAHTNSAPVPYASSETGAAATDGHDVEPPNLAELARALKAGRGHADPAIAALAVRVDGELQALVDMLAAYDSKAELRTRRDQLRAELEQVEAELNGSVTPEPAAAEPTTGALVCEECGQAFERPQALGAHRRYKHNGGTS